MSNLYAPPPMPTDTIADGVSSITMPQQPLYTDDASSSSNSSSIVVVIVVIASAVIVSALIYLLLRFLSKRLHCSSSRTFAAADDVHLQRNFSSVSDNGNSKNLLDPLPLFSFKSVSGNSASGGGGDCAVCLSKFEPHDQLRLLPLCCHAFHAGCIDTWLVTNQTCPLCRSTVIPSDSDALDKIHSVKNPSNNNNDSNDSNSSFRNGNDENGGSFTVQIGSVSRRRGEAESGNGERRRLSYSIGSFEYIVDDGYEVHLDSTTQQPVAPDCNPLYKQSSVRVQGGTPQGEILATEVSVGRNWMMDYIDRLSSMSMSSRTMSLGNSGRFFSGSARQSESVVAVEDLEANRIGDEISDFFQWLSGF